MMRTSLTYILAGSAIAIGAAALVGINSVKGGGPSQDPLAYMPGTQPDPQMVLEPSSYCMECHADYDTAVEPGHLWKGSMMSQAARDPLFWSAFTVAMQDAQWAFGSMAAADACVRCHLPSGWLRGRSAPVNGSSFTGDDFDGVSCNFCHRMYDPFFEDAIARESADFIGYWDETTSLSQTMADSTLAADRAQAADLTQFNGDPAYVDNRPRHTGYDENASGQYYVAKADSIEDQDAAKRGPYADSIAYHTIEYSRYHKSKFMCATCHDVSNAALANMAFANTTAGDGVTDLPTETQSAYSYHPAERTFSEFMSSVYGQPGGAEGTGAFAPSRFNTDKPGNKIATCQDCHMENKRGLPSFFSDVRPDSSFEHPKTGVGTHDLTGGNLWVPYLLASTVEGSPNYDAVNASILRQGAAALTLDLDQGVGLDPAALLDGVDRARSMLERAATIDIDAYNSETGELTFRIDNHTGHKLITGYPEGRRMFVNIKLYADGSLIHEVNPYDGDAGTLRGLNSEESPALSSGEAYMDDLVYETFSSSSITGESHTFHFLLADGKQKDNRIPPRGYDVTEAAKRLALPAAEGDYAVDLFSVDEYAGGYDNVTVETVAGADRIVITLLYQTTSREYIAFLRDEINGPNSKTLPTDAYIAQSDPAFDALRAWGDAIGSLWDHNKDVPGAAPVLMTVRSFPGYDVDGNASYNSIDIQLVINSVLGLDTGPYNCDANGDGNRTSVDIQLVINAALGLI